MQVGAIVIGALAFRGVSSLVAAVCAALFPSAVGATSSATDFGMYPLITEQIDRGAGRWFAGPVTPSVVVTWLAFAVAMVMLLRVAQLDLDSDNAEGAVLLAAVSPFAFVFGQRGADALFLAFALGAFYGFRRQRWIVGGLCGAGAAAAIPSGILIVPALAWIGWRDSGARALRIAMALGLTAAGFIAYLAFLYYRAGPPGGWASAMNRWGFHLGQAPWLSLEHAFTSHRSPVAMMNGAVTIIALASVPLVWWRLNGGYAIYMIAMLWLPLTSGRDESLGPATALLFPMSVLAASIRSRIAVALIAIASAMFYALALASSRG